MPRPRPLRSSLVLLSLVAFAGAAAAAAPPPDIPELLRAGGMEPCAMMAGETPPRACFQRDEDGLVEIYYRLEAGRSQSVMVREMEPLLDVPLVEIYSPVFRLESGRLDGEQGRRLLELNGRQKIGYYGLEAVGDTWWVIAYHNLPVDRLTPQALAMVLGAVALLADEAERQLRGPSVDET